MKHEDVKIAGEPELKIDSSILQLGTRMASWGSKTSNTLLPINFGFILSDISLLLFQHALYH